MDSILHMEIKTLESMEERRSVIDDWRKKGLSDFDAGIIEDDMLSNGSASLHWHGVLDKNDGMIIAIFDVRQVPLESPDYHKSMRIHFAPGFNPHDWERSGQSFETIAAIIDKTVPAMYVAFRHLVTEAESTREHTVKIYSDHPLRLLIFQRFAENLAKEAPDQYEPITYKKWVEIKHLQGGRHGSGSI